MGKGLPRSNRAGEPIKANIIKQTFTVNDTLNITGVAATVDAGTFIIAGLPEGNMLFLGAASYIEVEATGDADVIDNWDGDYGVGTVPNADVDLGDAEDDNIVPSTALSAGAADKIAPLTRGVSTGTESGVVIDNTDSSKELNLNLLIDDNVITDTNVGTFNITGFVVISYVMLGDD